MDTNNCCIYIHRCKVNQKAYIGWTSKQVEKRWQNGNGYAKDQPVFNSAIKKYGWDNFEHIIFAEKLTAQEAKHIEVLLIALYKTNCTKYKNPEYGYNMTDGGDGCVGRILSEDAKRKMSENRPDVSGENNPMYGKKHTEETRKKISEAQMGEKSYMYGRTHSQETKNKIRESKIGEKNPNYGKPLAEETKQKLRESLSGENHPWYGKKHSEETKLKMKEHHADFRGKNSVLSQQVYCKELDKIFYSMSEAERETGVNRNSIALCCKGQNKYAGRHPVTNEKLHWMFLG